MSRCVLRGDVNQFSLSFSPRTCFRGESRDLSSLAPAHRAIAMPYQRVRGSCNGAMGPGAGVVSREFSEELGGCLVIEASQAGAIVIGAEGKEVSVAFGMV